MATTAPASRAATAPSLDTSDFLETRSVQLEWKVTNLRQLFDQTKGDAKSKCIKSALFDQSRWQIFLYPNSGHDGYISVYLSCEPTVAEKERALAEQPALTAVDGAQQESQGGKEKERIPWRRDGKFLFTFEVRSIDRRVTFKQLESEKPHTFWYRERNWGYANFQKRNEAFYNNPSTRSTDAFLIICTIVSSPTLPTSPPLPHLLVPKTLIHAYASLFDDPDYSDVVFRIRPAATGTSRVREKRLYAAKKVLAGRSEYFEMMFSSAFSESTLTRPSASRRNSRPTPTTTTGAHSLRSLGVDSDADDSDDEEDDSDEGWDEDDDSGVDESDDDEEEALYDDEGALYEADDVRAPGVLAATAAPPAPMALPVAAPAQVAFPALQPAPESPEAMRGPMDSQPRSRTSSVNFSDEERPSGRGDGDVSAQDIDAEEDDRPSTPRGSRFVDAPSAPASPIRLAGLQREQRGAKQAKKRVRGDDRPRFEVVVTDAAYTTFRALLHFLYTDSISFTPLASTYYVAKDFAVSHGQAFPYSSRRAFLAAQAPAAADGPGAGAGTGVKTAAVGPASAKAIYRLADKMGLAELKERAYDHVVSSLTAQNIVYEVFGSFSSRFDEIRRVEVAFLLDKWNEVRAGPQMRKVFDYLRSPSRFPGFEDVWLEIVQNLEVRVAPPPALSAGAPGTGTAASASAGGVPGRGAAGGEESEGR